MRNLKQLVLVLPAGRSFRRRAQLVAVQAQAARCAAHSPGVGPVRVAGVGFVVAARWPRAYFAPPRARARTGTRALGFRLLLAA